MTGIMSVSKEAQQSLLEEDQSQTRYGQRNSELVLTSIDSDRYATRSIISRFLLPLLFLLSLLGNLVQGLLQHKSSTRPVVQSQACKSIPEKVCQPCPVPSIQSTLNETPYAGLSFNTTNTWTRETVFTQDDLDAADKEWINLRLNNGFVALDKQHAEQIGLPRSTPFPWDKGKEIYLVTSYHSMHCLTVLHRSNLEYRNNHTQTYATEHILHCLDNIRLDLECSADDTPRMVPQGSTAKTAKLGIGQLRQCRDWNQLASWTEQHSACFQYNKFLELELRDKFVWPDAWQFCGEGSEYLPEIQKHYHKNKDWIPPSSEWPEIDEIQEHYEPATGIS